MRGGTSKGVFFLADDLPSDPAARDRILMRVIGSPDRYGKHTDGMGGATSSTSKVVILSKSKRAGCDVDYLFGQVAIDKPLVDWSGNCGNLSAAVGPFAISMGLVDAPADGTGDGQHLAGQHQEEDREPRADERRRGAGAGRLPARRRGLPGRRGPARVPRPGRRRRRRGRSDVSHRQPHRRARRARPRQDRGDPDQCRQSHGVRRCRAARPQGHRAAGRRQRRQGAAGAGRGRCARWARSPWALPRRRRRRPPSASTRPSSPSSPSRRATRRPTAAPSRRARSTCWRASSPWACCTTP